MLFRFSSVLGGLHRWLAIHPFPMILLVFACACSSGILGGDQPSAEAAGQSSAASADQPWAYMGQPRPGRSPEIFAEGIVSTEAGMYGTIVFSPDLSEAVWGPEGVPWLLLSRVEGDEWTEPERLQFVPDHGLTSPFFSPDGQSLYFLAGPTGAHGEEDDIWLVHREGTGWGEPKRLDPTISAISTHWQFSLDSGGNLYFMSEGADIFRADYRDGRYSVPTRLPAPINTDAPETGPFISPDGSFLLFDRWFDSSPFIRIMVSFRDSSGDWGEPVDMSEVLGNESNDSAARVSPDGKYLFFQSVREGSSPSRSLYWVDAGVIESLRPGAQFVDSGQNLGDGRVFRVVPGDLDGDGDRDVVVVDFLGSSRIWINDGVGRFIDSGQALGGDGGHGAALEDLDGDGDLDLFFVHNGSTDRIFLNDGRGTLVDSGQEIGGGEDWGTTVALGDIDGDGDLDAYVTVFQGSGNLWINDGTGNFTDSGRGLEGNPTSVAFGDLDGDGALDAIVTYSGVADRVWLNSGAGKLIDSGQRLGPVDGWGYAALGDLDADGDLDAVVTNSEVGNEVWLNDGNGVFSPPAIYFGTGSRGALGDLDGDGTLDFVAISEGGAEERTCSYWLNDGRGGFTGIGTRIGSPGALSISLTDIDGDSDLDVILGRMEGKGGNRVLLNQRFAAGG